MEKFRYPKVFELESGESLAGLEIAYSIYGTLNAEKSNVIWVCHALTANSDVQSWWPGMVGEGSAFDPSKYFIVCANILGSCYGTTGPASVDPVSRQPYYQNFPFITIRDMVKAHILLREYLGVEKIAMLVGGSMGGYQALEWAVMEPERIQKLMLIATGVRETPWGIAIHSSQRMAIESDSAWQLGGEGAGREGLKIARAIAMITYRNPAAFELTQQETDQDKIDGFKASSYIQYQGEKLAKRFNAYSYYRLSKAMDTHNLLRGRTGSIEQVLGKISIPVLFIAIDSDLLFPEKLLRETAELFPNKEYHCIPSSFGHDGFLTEVATLIPLVKKFLPS